VQILPRAPSERVARAVLLASIVVTSALSFAVVLSFAEPKAAHVVVACAIASLLAVVLTRPLVKANHASRVEGSLDRFECVALASSKSLFVAGLLAVVPRASIAHGLGVVALVYALGLVLIVVARDRARALFLRRVYENEHERLRIERDDDVCGYELLPPVVSGTITDAVIAHVEPTTTYRSSGGPRPIARVTKSLATMLARIDKRSRVAAALAGVLVMATPIVMTSPLWHPPQAPPIDVHSVEIPVAPTCADAAPYFSERIEALDGVGRATLLTHRDDPTIVEGDGVILLVTQTGELARDAMKSRALEVARSIPCTNKLALTVVDPTLRSFDLEAILIIDRGMDEATVAADANAEVREIFEPSARAIFNERVGFGATEKMLGYRVRYALRRVVGVRSVRLFVDGSDADPLLTPREFPRIASLKLHVTRE